VKIGRAVFILIAATVLLGALVATTSAARLSSSSQTIRATFARINFAGGFGTTECPITLEGSFHSRTIVKTAGALAGYITRATLGRCLRGSGTILAATLPWHTRYQGFTGTLPNITKINATIAGAGWNIKEPVFAVECLAAGGILAVAFNREAGGAVTTLEASGESPTSCGISGALSGSSNSLTVLGSTGRITVTLI
jgi:hypothetical protein